MELGQMAHKPFLNTIILQIVVMQLATRTLCILYICSLLFV